MLESDLIPACKLNLSANGAAPAADQLYTFMQTFIEPAAWRDSVPTRWRLLTIPAILLLALGPSLVALILLAWGLLYRQHRHGSAHAARAATIIAMMLVAYLGVIAASWVPGNGDFTELNQRPFLAANVLIAVLALCAIWNVQPALAAGALAVAAVGHAVSSHGPHGIRPHGFPFDHAWHRGSYKINVDTHLIELSRALRTFDGRPTYAFVPVVKEGFSLFPESIVTAVSEAPAFLSRPGHYRRVLHNTAAQDFDRRVEAVDALVRCDGVAGPIESRGVRLGFIVTHKDIPCLEQMGAYGAYRLYVVPR